MAAVINWLFLIFILLFILFYRQKMRWLDSITDSMDMNLHKLQEIVKDGKAWHAPVHVVTESQTQLSN